MQDLFGDEVTAPQTITAKGIENAAKGFPEFWAAWPSGPRKVAKQQCLNKWASFGCANNAEHIVMHVEWMKTQDDWKKDGGSFVPMPATYLNQQRWLDWVAPAPVKAQPDALQAILSHKGAPMPNNVKQRLAELRKEMRV
jgi:hypothetical protein